MTVFFCVLLFIVALYLILKRRKRALHGTERTKEKTKQSTTDETIPMNDVKDNNDEPTTS